MYNSGECHCFFTLSFVSGYQRTGGLPQWLRGKESTCNAGDPSLIPGFRRSPGEGNGYPLQYSYLGNPMDRGAWWVTIHVVSKESNIATKTATAREFAFELLTGFLLDIMIPDFFLRLCFISKHSLGISSWHSTDTFNSTEVNLSRFPVTDFPSSGVNSHSSPSHLSPNTGIFHNSVFFSPQINFFPHLPFTILYKWPLDSLVNPVTTLLQYYVRDPLR